MSLNVANFTDDEKKNAFTLLVQQLKMEQIWFQQHKDSARSWEAKLLEDFYNYNSVRQAAVDQLVSQHSLTHFPVLHIQNAEAIGEAVGVCMGTYADKLGVSKDEVFKVMIVNCAYLGTNAHSVTTVLAKLVGEIIASNPAYSCAVVICSNA